MKNILGNNQRNYGELINAEDLIKSVENYEIPKKNIPKSKSKKPVQNQTPNLFNGNISYSFLEGDFAETILREYNNLVQNQYQNASALNVLSFEDNVVKGSNPFAFVLLNKILREHGKWIARPSDLERVLETGVIDLKRTYGDSGLVLRDDNSKNEYLAKQLGEQIRQKGYSIEEDTIMMPLAGLDIKYDSKSPHNLSFQLTDYSEIITASQLNKSNHGKKFNKGDEKGLPIFEDNGSRTLYSNENGLCRLYRYWSLDLDAGDDGLASSDSDGRVVVCAEGTSPKK